jgi:hypothetical protein
VQTRDLRVHVAVRVIGRRAGVYRLCAGLRPSIDPRGHRASPASNAALAALVGDFDHSAVASGSASSDAVGDTTGHAALRRWRLD